MAAQFDVYRTISGSVIVIIQNDLHDLMVTRAVAALIPYDELPQSTAFLNPVLDVQGERYVLAPQVLATLTLGELGEKLGSLAGERDQIIRAVDTLFAGV